MIELGREVKDRVTGFRGIAVARSAYLLGCNRILVQPKVGKDMAIPDALSFDEPDLEVVGNGILPKPEPGKNGGPRPMASRALEPRRQTLTIK